MKLFRTILLSAILVLGVTFYANAAGKTVVLKQRPGGSVALHILEALYWSQLNTKLVITKDQWSAAAMQVVFYKRNTKNLICAKPGVRLHFHRPFVVTNGKRIPISDAELRQMWNGLFGTIHAAKIGYNIQILPWRTMKPAEFGIPNCK